MPTVSQLGFSQLSIGTANDTVRSSHLPSTSKPLSAVVAREHNTNLACSTFLRSNYVMLGTVFGAAFGMQLAFDTGSDKIWDSINKGRQWKDIKYRYVEQPDDE
ncbi:hypothetical protein CC78DRAFT_455201 [Lojkania enalia]|uniref:Complex III subunit 9 n=1 Tax=Lojkania enalia TaxID=147567 RepID=A0A9P4KGC0_9PLEO|nr:hypothetical protein CC78DRAFT_455201 [Didymosphaeria enalia]